MAVNLVNDASNEELGSTGLKTDRAAGVQRHEA
jgi:hypothetical protein